MWTAWPGANRCRRMLIQLPLPPRGCSSNGNKGSWRKKASATKVYRTQAFWATAEVAGLEPKVKTPVRMSLTFCTKGVRVVGLYAPRDISNAVAAFKGAQDGICDALRIPDSHQFLQLGAVTIDPTRGPFVLVEIEEVHATTPDQRSAAEVRPASTGVGA